MKKMFTLNATNEYGSRGEMLSLTPDQAAKMEDFITAVPARKVKEAAEAPPAPPTETPPPADPQPEPETAHKRKR